MYTKELQIKEGIEMFLTLKRKTQILKKIPQMAQQSISDGKYILQK